MIALCLFLGVVENPQTRMKSSDIGGSNTSTKESNNYDPGGIKIDTEGSFR